MISENSSRVLGFSIVPERVAESVSRLCPRFCQSLISQLWPRAPNLPSSAAIMEIQVCTVKQRLPRWYSDKEFACQCRRCIFDPWVGKIPWRRAWQPTPVLLPGESHRQRSLAGYSPWVHEESDTTERLTLTHILGYLGDSDSKESTCNAGDLGLIPGLGRSPGRRHGNPLQYFCLENPHGQRSLPGYNI